MCRQRRLSARSEEHTSELQSRFDLVCRLLLEKKKERARQIEHAGLQRPHTLERLERVGGCFPRRAVVADRTHSIPAVELLFKRTATTKIDTLSLHAALPI